MGFSILTMEFSRANKRQRHVITLEILQLLASRLLDSFVVLSLYFIFFFPPLIRIARIFFTINENCSDFFLHSLEFSAFLFSQFLELKFDNS